MSHATTDQQPPEAEAPPWVNVPASITNDGQRIELVLLVDVVRWLMRSNRLRLVPAALALHEALVGFPGLVLYRVTPGGAARPVGPDDTFGLARPSGRRVFSRGIDGGHVPRPPAPALPSGVTPGQSAALFFVQKVWGGGLYDESTFTPDKWAASDLAMPCRQAAELWDAAGESADDACDVSNLPDMPALVRLRKANKGMPWDKGNQLEVLQREYARLGGTPAAHEVLALALGTTRQNIAATLGRERKRPAPGKTGRFDVISFEKREAGG